MQLNAAQIPLLGIARLEDVSGRRFKCVEDEREGVVVGSVCGCESDERKWRIYMCVCVCVCVTCPSPFSLTDMYPMTSPKLL